MKTRVSPKSVKTHALVWKAKALSVKDREAFLIKFVDALSSGVKVGVDLVVGFNSVSRLINSGNIKALVVSRETHLFLHAKLIEAAMLRKIPVLSLPKADKELSVILGFKHCSCFAIPEPASAPDRVVVIDRKKEKLDDILEFLKDKATPFLE